MTYFIFKAIRDILLLAHRQAFCWTDEWYEKTYESIVEYERETYGKTNERVVNTKGANGVLPSPKTTTPAHQLPTTTASFEKNMADFD